MEQTSSAAYPNILAVDYLKKARVASPQILMTAENYLNVGYQKLLTFERPGGGFDWWGSGPPLVFAAIKETVRIAETLSFQDTMSRVSKRQFATVELLAHSEDKLEGARAFSEKREPVFVRQNHHVFLAFAVPRVEPHKRKKHGGVLRDIGYARPLIHGRGAREELVDIKTLQRHRHQSDRAHHRCSAADPVVHRKSRKPSILFGMLVKFASDAGHGDRMFSKLKPGRFEFRFRFQHAVARFFGAARF